VTVNDIFNARGVVKEKYHSEHDVKALLFARYRKLNDKFEGTINVKPEQKKETPKTSRVPDAVIVDGRFTAAIEATAGSPPIFIAASESRGSKSTKSALELYNEGKAVTEPSLPEDVTVTNMLSKKDIADSVFDASYRAMARFMRPIDEVAIEKVHRLRCDGVEWKYIGRTIYREENGKDISEEDLPTYVDSLRKQHKRQYPDHYPTEK